MSKKYLIISTLILSLLVGLYLLDRENSHQLQDSSGTLENSSLSAEVANDNVDGVPQIGATILNQLGNSLQIETMRQGSYPGSEILVEDELTAGSNYQRFLVSYQSEGNKIFALMTIPNGTKPETGWPVIVFNHGYIPPTEYRTTEKYVAYVDNLARAGYIVFKSDYRGHGSSEGEALGGYGSPAYTVDVLNAVTSLKNHPEADPSRIGMWGHSMGGYITLRNMVVTKDVKAGVIWGGVVADYAELLSSWQRRGTTPPPMPSGARRWREVLQEAFGTPEANSGFWNSISSNTYVKDISGPIQLHHARGDETVPWEFSQGLADDLNAADRENQLFLYDGDNHNITGNFGVAMRRTIAFFDTYVKGT